MFRIRPLPAICASCRLNVAILRARQARLPCARRFQSSTFIVPISQRLFSTNVSRKNATPLDEPITEPVIEARVRQARETFGDALPVGYLTDQEFEVYHRLYGMPVFIDQTPDLEDPKSGFEGQFYQKRLPEGEVEILERGEDGRVAPFDFFSGFAGAGREEAEGDERSMEELLRDTTPFGITLLPRHARHEGIAPTDRFSRSKKEPSEEAKAKEGREKSDTTEDKTSRKELEEDYKEQKNKAYHETVYENSRLAREEVETRNDEEEEEENDFMRAHPLTKAGRSRTSPTTIFLPKEAIIDPTAILLTRANHKHLTETANRIFGGPGLPFSASTLPARFRKEQKPIPLDASQSTMSNIDADAYIAAVQPGIYASIMQALVEVRRRLGSSWLEHMLRDKKGGTILDAGSSGMGVVAWHEVLNAEWQRMHDESGNTSKDETPLGKATVLTGSDSIRQRASKLLENTTFIPRLPDVVPKKEELNIQQPRKLYDLIIAPHTLWSLGQNYLRKELVGKYWSLLNPNGGVLILIEKGLPRGFEVIAGARSYLLDKHISSPGSETYQATVNSQVSKPDEDSRFVEKEIGMIIAPCTNHSSCPMYQSSGISPGRKDFCYFNQRYIRPPYLQRILKATDRNHEDVQFSYIAVQRGRDHRRPEHDVLGKGFIQSEESTAAAFEGHEWMAVPTSESSSTSDSPTSDSTPKTEEYVMKSTNDVNLLTLPRIILQPLKRPRHIILDVCTPSGTLERWTVPKSFSKQAFHDARKARWGDLWALGAKTRVPRNVRLGRPGDEYDDEGRKIKKSKNMVIEVAVDEKDGEAVEARPPRILGRGDRSGRYTSERKIRGSGGRKGRKKRFGSSGGFPGDDL